MGALCLRIVRGITLYGTSDQENGTQNTFSTIGSKASRISHIHTSFLIDFEDVVMYDDELEEGYVREWNDIEYRGWFLDESKNPHRT